MTAPLTLAQAHARWVQAKKRSGEHYANHECPLAISGSSNYSPCAVCRELGASEAALLALPSAPQEPPQVPCPVCGAAHWGETCSGSVASAPQTVSAEALAPELRIVAERLARTIESECVSIMPGMRRFDPERAAEILWDALSTAPAPAQDTYGSEVLCEACAVTFCPHGERLHFHHDGCPACDADSTEAVPPQGWQPIATAPSGTMLLLCSMSPAIEARDWCFVDWIVAGQCVLRSQPKPTHWMPLPAPPEAER